MPGAARGQQLVGGGPGALPRLRPRERPLPHRRRQRRLPARRVAAGRGPGRTRGAHALCAGGRNLVRGSHGICSFHSPPIRVISITTLALDPPGAGGFIVVPGSHKSDLGVPATASEYQAGPTRPAAGAVRPFFITVWLYGGIRLAISRTSRHNHIYVAQVAQRGRVLLW